MNSNRYVAILWKRLWMIVLLFAVTMTVILLSALSAKPVYEAQVRLQVIPMESEQVGLYSEVRGSPIDPIDLTASQFSQVVKSGAVAWRTIAQLGLTLDAQTLLRGLRTAQEYDFLSVVVQAGDPQQAEAIINTQVENALTAYRTDRARPAVVTGEFLMQQLAEAEQQLATAQSGLLRFNLTHNVDSLERELQAYQDTAREMRRGKENVALEIARLTGRIAGLEAEAVAADAAARTAAAEAARVATPKSTDEAAATKSDDELAALRRAGELREVASNLRTELAGQRGQEAEYERAIARWETELTSLIGLSEENQKLNNAVIQARGNRDFLSAKAMESRLKQQQGLNVGYLKIVEPARAPDQPLPNRTFQLALVGGVLSIVAGVILAFLFEFVEALGPGGRRRP
jgi:uncharacterized protein involved in exopolysaccharide biosynthesis